jgi:F-type H+-transporting ATPase subunit delta
MAELTTVARPYAEAVFRAAVEANATAPFGEALLSLGLAAGNVQMSALLGNPKVTASEKAGMLAAAAGGSLATPVANLVSALLENGKAALLPFISEHYQRLQRDHDGVVKAIITSAFPLTDAEKADLVAALAKKYSKKIEVDVVVDESLIGGARIKVGDDVIHASVRDTLDQMKQALMA